MAALLFSWASGFVPFGLDARISKEVTQVLADYDRDFLTPQEVAHELGSDQETVRGMIRRGVIPAKKIGFRWYVAKEWLSTPSNRKEYA